MALDSYRELLDELASSPPLLKEAAAAAGDPPEGEWGAAEVLAHMADVENLYFERLNTLLHEQNPALRPPTDGGRMEEMRNRSWEENLDAFNAIRGDTISLLMGMTLNDWGRSGIHPTRGTITVEDVVEAMIDHDLDHINQLRALAP